MLSAQNSNLKDQPLQTELVLPNGQVLVNHLKSRFSDNEIDPSTATITLYAEYENDKGLLIPGNYVDIRIGNKEPQMAILVPQAALAQDEHGNYVMTVNNDNVTEQKRVVLGDVIEDSQVVLEGLSGDDKVIIQGLQKVKDGQNVKAQLITDTQEAK